MIIICLVRQVSDILHPLSSLVWEERPSLPVGMYDAQAVFLDGTLHVGGGVTTGSIRDDAKLYSCKPDGDGSWTATDTPTYYYALTTYDSCLVLVGGREYPSEVIKVTNKVYTMLDGLFREILPPMILARSSSSVMSSGSTLAVAGGQSDSGPLSFVEVYINNVWTTLNSLPESCSWMKSSLYNGFWYLTGGWGQYKKQYRVPLYSFASESQRLLWEELADAPFEYSACALFGARYLSVGGSLDLNPKSAIHAYSPHIKAQWLQVAELPTALSCATTIVLPNNELMVIGGNLGRNNWSQKVFQASIVGGWLVVYYHQQCM